MFLNKKSLQILNIFLTLKKYKILELEKILKIKKRSILINIETINTFLYFYKAEGILREKEYFYLSNKDMLRIKELLLHAPLKPNERIEYILLKLLSVNKMVFSNSFLELDVTSRTLSSDLKKLKERLQIYNLILISLPSKGISLYGKEIDIRNLYTKYLTKYLIEQESCHQLFNKLIKISFNENKLDQIKKKIFILLKRINVTLPKEYFFEIVSIVLINENRKNLTIVENYKTAQYLLDNKYYKILIEFLKVNGFEKLNLCELDKIAEIFLFFDKEKNMEELDYEVIEFIKALNSKLKFDISNDKEFLIKLSNIIRIGKLKLNLNFIECKESYKLNKDYKKYYNEIKKDIREIIPKFYEEDITYLTVLIKNKIDEINCNDEKIVIIVDDSFNHIYGSLISKYVERNYYINVSKILYSYELKEEIKLQEKLNFIITLNDNIDKTIKIPMIKVPVDIILNNNYELEKYGFLKK